jgi:hypothetical protein
MPNATHVLAGAAAALCTGSLAVAIHAQNSADEARAQAAAWRAQALQQAGDATASADATPSPAQTQSGSGAQPVLPSTQQDSQAPQAVPQTPRTRES